MAQKQMTPTPDEIRQARQQAGFSQTAAAALIGKSLRAWQNWEAPEGSVNHRRMDAALWELWQMKAQK